MVSTTRTQYRDAVAAIAEKARATLPLSVNGRIESAVRLVLLGEVQPQADGSIQVGSCTDPTKVYHLEGTACDCADFPRAPGGWCKHRVAAGIQKRVREQLPESVETQNNCVMSTIESPQPLPEAPASVNVHLMIAGRQVQLTLRDTDEGRLLARLEAVLARFPVPEQPVADTRQCPLHHVPMRQTTKNGHTWYSHKAADGQWCKGR
jgi:hypothetical protein